MKLEETIVSKSMLGFKMIFKMITNKNVIIADSPVIKNE